MAPSETLHVQTNKSRCSIQLIFRPFECLAGKWKSQEISVSTIRRMGRKGSSHFYILMPCDNANGDARSEESPKGPEERFGIFITR